MKAWRLYKYVEDFCGASLYYWAGYDATPVWSTDKKLAKIIFSRKVLIQAIKDYDDIGAQVEEINLCSKKL